MRKLKAQKSITWDFYSYICLGEMQRNWKKTARQKQPSRGVLKKRCSENMQQIYMRTPMPKCNFSKVAKQLYWNRTSAWVFSWTAASERIYCKYLQHLIKDLWSVSDNFRTCFKGLKLICIKYLVFLISYKTYHS